MGQSHGELEAQKIGSGAGPPLPRDDQIRLERPGWEPAQQSVPGPEQTTWRFSQCPDLSLLEACPEI